MSRATQWIRFRRRCFVAAAAPPPTGIKRALLDQTLVTGVGNIYADEALWRATLHYAAADRTLSRQARSCWRAFVRCSGRRSRRRHLLRRSLRRRQRGVGYFERSLEGLRSGRPPCPRCGTPIRREPFMNRSSFRCPRCQPGRDRPAGERGEPDDQTWPRLTLDRARCHLKDGPLLGRSLVVTGPRALQPASTLHGGQHMAKALLGYLGGTDPRMLEQFACSTACRRSGGARDAPAGGERPPRAAVTTAAADVDEAPNAPAARWSERHRARPSMGPQHRTARTKRGGGPRPGLRRSFALPWSDDCGLRGREAVPL